MGSYCKITIVGNIGDVQAAISKANNPYLRMSVAVDQPGSDTPTWFQCIITGRKVENTEKLLGVFKKGRLVLIEGVPRSEGYLTKEGKPAVKNTILVDNLPLLMDPKPKV
jgi:single-stranded DNA-binding protein